MRSVAARSSGFICVRTRRAHAIDDDLVDRWVIVRVADRVMEGIDAEQPVLLDQLERFANESA